ncbi:MAG TPA: hypothetical protein VIL95_07755 [Bacillota bacterium]
MSPVVELVREADTLGIRLWLDDEGLLRADVPEDAPPEADTLLDKLSALARDVKAYLRAQALRQTAPDGTERMADDTWVPPFGQTWPEGPEPAVSQDDLTGWPADSIQALRLYHQPPVLNAPHARLYPLIGRKVRTPHGVGKLLAAYSWGCPVVLNGRTDEAVLAPWWEVRPL